MSISKYLDYFNNDPPDELLVTDFIEYDSFEAGATHYFLLKNSVRSIKDIGWDPYSSWSTIDKHTNTRTKSKTGKCAIALYDGYFKVDENGEFILKFSKITHSRCKLLTREIAYIVDSNQNLFSNVLIIYCAKENLIPPLRTTKRCQPSLSEHVKSVLKYRKTSEAKQILAEEGFFFSSKEINSLSRGVPNHIKSNSGKKKPSDFYKLYDRYLAKPNKEEVMEKPVIDVDGNGKITSRVIVGFPNAFKCFSSGLPTIDDLKNHWDYVQFIETLEPPEAKKEFNKCLRDCNTSGSLTMGSALTVDTTFSLTSAEYVTICLGISECFLNKVSNKNSSILLCYMIHSTKSAENHEHFSRFINDMLKNADTSGTKYVGCLIVDGEDAFKNYNIGEKLKHATLLRCDTHRLSNLKRILQSDPKNSIDDVQQDLYGFKENGPQGVFVLDGILNCLSRKSYNQGMLTYILETEDKSPLRKWLNDNFDSLFDSNSMIQKLKAGWPVQFMTTNVIESRNSHFKQIITAKKPAEDVVDDFLKFHKEEISVRLNSIIGLPSTLKCLNSLNQFQWKAMSLMRRKEFLCLYGLEKIISDTDFLKYPSWMFDDENLDSFMKSLEKLEVHTSSEDSNTFFCYCSEKNETTRVDISSTYAIRCYHNYCLRQKNKSMNCIHKFKVLIQQQDEKQNKIIDSMQKMRRATNLSDMLRFQMKPQDGTKYARIRKSFSANNSSRAISGIGSSSLEMDESYTEEC